MAGALQETSRLLKEHLRLAGLPDDGQLWAVAQSPLGGRGLVASRDIAPGELVFYDVPLVLGPRAGAHCPPVCAGCLQGFEALLPCSRGCGLPVCSSQCESVPLHRFECQKLSSWGVRTNGSWSRELLRASTPVRCLALSPTKRQVLQCLQRHGGSQHAFEVDILKQKTEKGPSTEEEAFMRLACCVMDANAFETAQIPLVKAVRTEEGTTPSLRGLYPLASMMNHACTPNTRHGYDERQRMAVRAAMHIPAGTEITNSYTSLLWGTTARRYQLAVTKHFLCACSRCSDPQEGGSRLAALRCLTPSCQGSMFPTEPLDDESMWECELCGCQATGRKAAITQGTLGRLLCIVDSKNIAQMERFLCEHHHVMPSTNQIVVEVKCNLIRSYGHATGYSWTDVTTQKLELKERLCREVLQLLETLRAGQCRLRGLLLYELHCVLMELRARRGRDSSDATVQDLGREALACVQEAAEILAGDITAPVDIELRLSTCRRDVTTA
ncbi:protein msta-like isoform X2 [Zootermopsis nevadensis]|uniref:protein msta-like isoform X2 n=1 Tax=Zootermopsis nevadensis TaxID=136037 RepID=UPI000B8EACBF|nr:protein msta-like isoform X2 [Zootermopsis nevadensis]